MAYGSVIYRLSNLHEAENANPFRIEETDPNMDFFPQMLALFKSQQV
jgi:hypothetical protein